MTTHNDLIIAANRLPIHFDRERNTWATSPGGLVSALKPVLARCNGTWIGWSGVVDDGGEKHPPPPTIIDDIRLQTVPLSRKEVDEYYYGFANRALWPLFHDGVREPEFNTEHWARYEDVNGRFAESIAEIASRDGKVWIQDYHLLLTPGLIKQLRPDLRVGLFFHTPVPPGRLFATVPWRDALISSLRTADVVGTQTPLDAEHLERSLRGELTPGEMSHEAVETTVKPYPISIDAEKYRAAAMRAENSGIVSDLRRSVSDDRVLCLGVDRLDYTKGIDVRLEALKRALETGRLCGDDVAFVQIAVPSRDVIDDYDELSSRVDALVGEINGRFADPAKPIVTYIKRSLPFGELIPYYRAADIMLITAVRDGMNLVAKEYAATRFDGSGQLVLSEFAGAAHELRSHVTLVNPYDVQSLSDQLVFAVKRAESGEMTKSCREAHEQVLANDVHRWADSFLTDLANHALHATSTDGVST